MLVLLLAAQIGASRRRVHPAAPRCSLHRRVPSIIIFVPTSAPPPLVAVADAPPPPAKQAAPEGRNNLCLQRWGETEGESFILPCTAPRDDWKG